MTIPGILRTGKIVHPLASFLHFPAAVFGATLCYQKQKNNDNF